MLDLTAEETEALLTLLEPADPDPDERQQQRYAEASLEDDVQAALYEKVRRAASAPRPRGRRCVHCGRRVRQVTTDRGPILGPITYWTHVERDGADTNCHLSAEVA